jgi:TetR/AcrR family transcriptional regulator
MTATDVPIPRMKAEDRRELVIESATAVFGDYGYYGTTTDQIARAAGVSQPYVVRMFGTKEKLFVEVLERALQLLLEAFRGALADDDGQPLTRRLGLSYVGLLVHRGLLLSLMHAFVLGSDPVIGARARDGFLQVYEFLRTEAGMSADEAGSFLAGGMLSNTMIGLRMTDMDSSDPIAHELLMACFPEKLEVVVGLGDSYRPEPK